jgi:hypothetical protein
LLSIVIIPLIICAFRAAISYAKLEERVKAVEHENVRLNGCIAKQDSTLEEVKAGMGEILVALGEIKTDIANLKVGRRNDHS